MLKMNTLDRFYDFIHPIATKKSISITGICSLILLAILSVIDKSLTNSIAPHGIVSFELSASLLHTLKILASWNAAAKIWAGISLGLDYLFLIAYPLFFLILIVFMADKVKKTHPILFYTGMVMGFLQIAAGLLDGLENYALIQILTGRYSEFFVSMANMCASLKFGFIVLGIFYILIMLARIGYDKNS